jgi:hypothetical protein
MAQNDGFKTGDEVKVCDPDNPFFLWTGKVVGQASGEDIGNRVERYYYMTVSVPGKLEGVRLTFSEYTLKRK